MTCKLVEHLVLSHMAKFIAKRNILLDHQHGFRAKLSTETQLIETINNRVVNINDAKQTEVRFLYFSKTSDKVCHHKLIYKLDFYGIRGKINTWIKAFLHSRIQSVSVLSGVPQGSILGTRIISPIPIHQ